MIVNERLTSYLHSLDRGNGELLDRIEAEAVRDFVPIIRKETGALLKTLVALKQPRAILEVGTAVGYSALLMGRAMPAGCHLTTIEKYEKRLPIARENFRRAGMEDRITLLEGDAEEILAGLTGTWDFIFMDAAKGQYLHWLPMLLRLMPERGVLISDNVLQDGDLIESRYAVERRNRTIHSRMREYLYALTHMEELETSVLPIGDGVTVSVKKDDRRILQNHRIEEETDERTGAFNSSRKSGRAENCCHLRRRCSLHRRRGLRTSGESEKLYQGRYEGGNRLCPRERGKGLCDRQYFSSQ